MSLESGKKMMLRNMKKLPMPAIAVFCLVCLVFAGWTMGIFSQEVPAPSQEAPSPDSQDVLTIAGANAPAKEKPGDSSRQLVRIGVLARGGAADCAIRYKATADYLTDKIEGYRFAIVPIRSDDFLEAVRNGEADFTIASPLVCVQLQAEGRVSVIATMQGDFDGVRFSQLGGVIFCRSDRSDIKSLKDIPDKSFAAVSENSLSWVASANFLLSQRIKPKEDASDFDFLGTNAKVVHEVTKGTYDLGAVDTGTLERMAKSDTIKISDYRIFNVSKPTPDFPFVSSTPLYPEWGFARTSSVSNALAAKVAVALYGMSEKSKAAQRGRYAGWMVPASYQSVWVCYENVRAARAEQSRIAISNAEAWGIFWILVVLLIIEMFYVMVLKRKLHISNAMVAKQTEAMVAKENKIHDLKQRVAVITGEERGDMNIIRHDYRIEYLTSEWEEKYGPGVGQYCYHYFADREEPCPECSLRDAFKKDRVCSMEKSFPREEGRPLRVTTIPLSNGSEGTKLFGQIYCDVLAQNRRATLSTLSQERETRYLLIQGMVRQSQNQTDSSAKKMQVIQHWFEETTPPQNVDINSLVQQVVGVTEYLWDPIAELSFDLSSARPTVWAPDLDMRIVIANLIFNAVSSLRCGRYSPKHKGVITLSTQVKGDSVFFMVMDNGDAQSLMDLNELVAEPGSSDNLSEDFIKIGLWPTYSRVFEKWNGKLRINRPDEQRMIRTVVLPVVTNDLLMGAGVCDTGVSQTEGQAQLGQGSP